MKRYLAFLAAMLLLLASCNSTGADVQPSAEDSGGGSSQSGEAAGGAVETDSESPPDRLTMYTTFLGGPESKGAGESKYYQIIQEKTNVTVDFITGQSSDMLEQLSLLAASDDLPDIIEGEYKNFPGANIQKCLADGLIIPLNDLMDQGHTPNFKALMDRDAEVSKLSRTDEGQFYAFPMVRAEDSYLVFGGIMVRQDWLDDLGLEMPTTIKEWDTVLRAFKEEKGATSALSGAFESCREFRHAYGIAEDFFVDTSTGEIKYTYLEPGYRDHIEQFSLWYADGLLDPDLYTQDIDAVYAKISMDKIGALSGYTGSTFTKINTMKADNPEMNFVPAPHPVVESIGSFPMNKASYRVNEHGAAISANCENPQAAARFMDYVYGEEGTILSNYGVEGESFVMENGQPVLTELITNNPDGYSLMESITYYAGAQNKPFIVEGYYQKISYLLPEQVESLDLWNDQSGSIRLLPPLTLTAEESQELGNIMSDVKTYAEENQLKFITGYEPLSNMEQFQENLRSMNVERAIEIQQAAYDRFVNRS